MERPNNCSWTIDFLVRSFHFQMERRIAFLLIIIIRSFHFHMERPLALLMIIRSFHFHMERPLAFLLIIFFRSFHFHMERPLAFLLIIIIIIILPPTFEIIHCAQFTKYHFETSYMISVSFNLFGTHSLRPNTFPIRSYLPEHRKPCYHLNSETVTDTRKPKGGKFSENHRGHSLHFGRKDSTSPSRGITPSKSEPKPVSVKTQKR